MLKKLKRWYENKPVEGIFINDDYFVYAKHDRENKIIERKIDTIDFIKEYLYKEEPIMLNIPFEQYKVHIISIDAVIESKDEMKKIILWKLKNRMPYIEEADIVFSYLEMSSGRYLVFSMEKSSVENKLNALCGRTDYFIVHEII